MLSRPSAQSDDVGAVEACVLRKASQAQADILTSDYQPGVPASTARWGSALILVIGAHIGLGLYLTATVRDALDGTPQDAITIDMVPDTSEQSDKPDDVAGPQVVESSASTSEDVKADDPDPPAPDAAPPTETKKEPLPAPDLTAPPVIADAQALLPPMEKPPEKPADRPPDPKPPIEKEPEIKRDKVEHPTAPSQASSGSAALLSGGRRPSAAAQATWRGEIGTHLVKNRRYPQEARAQGMQGVVQVKVTIDGKGHVLDEKLAKSSGRSLLDSEALALMKRADPFPAPPSDMTPPVTMTVPVNFSIR